MGTYTSVRMCDLRVVDRGGLVEWLNEKEAPVYASEEYNPRRNRLREDIERDNDFAKSGELSGAFDYVLFTGKIVGYWSVGWLELVRDFAQFVRGELLLECDDNVSFAKLVFEDGDVWISQATLRFSKRFAPHDLNDGLMPLPDDVRVARKI